KASSRRKRLARRSASRPRPTPIAAGRLRPARPPGFGGAGVTRARWAPAWIWRICRRVSGGSPPVVLTACSDLEQLSLLAGEKLVDGVDALLRQALELLLRTVDLVLADVAVLLQAVELVLGLAAVVADRDAGVLGLGLGELDVVLAALLGEGGQDDADDVAVVRRVDAEVGLAQRLDDRGRRAAVVGLDEDGARLGDGEGAELLQRRGRPVVVDEDLAEHPGVGAAGADVAELLAGRLDRPVHLLLGLEEDLVDHRVSFIVSSVAPGPAAAGTLPSTVTSVPIFSPSSARVTLPGSFMPKTRIVSPLSMHSENAAA